MNLKDTIVSFKTKSAVNLRKNYNSNSEILLALDKNEELIVKDSFGNWLYVVVPKKNLNGFVSKKYVQRNVEVTESREFNLESLGNETLYTATALLVLCIALITFFQNKIKNLKREKKITEDQLLKYKPIIDVETKVKELDNLKNELNQKYLDGKNIYDELNKRIDVFRSEADLIEYGIYEPIFNYNTSDEYKLRIRENYLTQKKIIKDKNACVCHTDWSVDGSRQTGRKWTNRQIRLTLRAFNGECDSLISKVTWNNINRLISRIEKVFEMINKLNETSNIYITDSFLKYKIEQLKLNHELKLKVQEEKEKAKEQRSALREEEKARRDFEKAQKEALEKEVLYKKALEEARKELGLASKEEVVKLEEKIKNLETELEETLEKFERAKSMAQQTKRGHVYVVSNIGSFGEDIYKIGMTRRLDPMDRVKELGDASVPFRFDMHAMIYTEDAPKLENLLHSKFDHLRVNKVNNRKEYFNVSIEEIESCINENFKEEFELIKDIEAKEYKETLYLKEKITEAELKEDGDKFPEKLF